MATGLLTVLNGIKRGARDWAANAKANSWLAQLEDRLRSALVTLGWHAPRLDVELGAIDARQKPEPFACEFG